MRPLAAPHLSGWIPIPSYYVYDLQSYQVEINWLLPRLIVGLLDLRLLEGVGDVEGTGIEASIFIVGVVLRWGTYLPATIAIRRGLPGANQWATCGDPEKRCS